MAERKVVNKYYPPDFDPAKIGGRQSKTSQLQIKVRTMLSMSIRCESCGTYINKGTKFNCRKEKVIGETYLGIQIFRFYIKCTACCAEILIKTDPQHSDYVVEAGARRVSQDHHHHHHEKKKQENIGDAMASLEIRRLASKKETETLVALHELKSIKSRHAHVTLDSMLQALQPSSAPPPPLLHDKQQQQLIEEEVLLDDVFQTPSRHRFDPPELHTVTKKRKPSYYYLSIPKKSTHESSNGLALLRQQYDTVDDQEA